MSETTRDEGTSIERAIGELSEEFERVLSLIRNEPHDQPDPGEHGAGVVRLDDEHEDSSEELRAGQSAVVVEGAETGGATGIKRKSFSHHGTDWLNPLATREGTDTFPFTVPSNHVYSHYELQPIQTTFPHELRVTGEPAAGATGSKKISVKWKLWGGGQVSYQIGAVYHERGAAPRLEVVVGSANWEQRAIQLIEQGKRFRLLLTGPDAARLWTDITKFFGAPVSRGARPETTPRDAETDPVVTPTVLITLGIVTSVVAIAGFATLALVLTKVIDHGCDAKAGFQPGEGVAGSLVFDIDCK